MITPSNTDSIQSLIDDSLLNVHVALPGKIQSYDSERQIADIEPQIRRVLSRDDDTFATETLPVFPNVPVIFPRSKDYFVSFPLAEGDFGLIVFNEYSIDSWRNKGRCTDPNIAVARHTCNGAVFIPGWFPNKDALTGNSSSAMMMGHNTGAKIEITENKITVNTHLTVDS
ncbi:MAG: hypothetical protein JRD89_09240 [Deltaproteobacteria bacterium]|nr:hypothetical protein [Deltaproteobacteria bacterium]